jgi:predicted methyltransferase
MLARTLTVAAAVATTFFAAPALAADTAAVTTPAIDSVLASNHRSPENKGRDAFRHPKETLAFFGLKPDMTVVEIAPGGGWYTEILAPLLKDQGKLVLAHADPNAGTYGRRTLGAFLTKLAGQPDVYGKAEVATFVPGKTLTVAPGSADMVLTFRNVHNWMGGGQADAAFKQFFAALKPGGVLGVVEHRWPESGVDDPKGSKGYVKESAVIRMAEAAGFKLAARSEINANPKDTKDYAKGVWTLPPGFAEGDKDRARYAAIGESDRMTLKFVKP